MSPRNAPRNAPRIAPAQAPYPPAVARTLDQLKTPGDQPLSLFRTLARDARLFARFTGAGLLDPGHLNLREREIVIHRTCALNRCGYEWGVHATIFADAAGLDAEQLAATAAPGIAACWGPREALLIGFCDAVHASADLDDGLWARLAEAFSEEACIELMLLAGFYRTVSLLANGLRLEMEGFAAPPPWA
ncbi:carboxymuconolactone decarboxylase family protein [Caulobacter sp. 1776]|uniref:carboxymuconolactone decarboxylase family protein n=1 Tax=Caulobacter sp. 1776 TaxID=3156420 RepID=UPI00339A57E8